MALMCLGAALALLGLLQPGTSEVVISGSNATTIGHCIFYGNSGVDCRGRLRCKPSDFRGTTTTADDDEQSPLPPLPDLELVCPGIDEFANGTWRVIQGIVPSQYANIPYPAEIAAKCLFRTNGTFACVGGPVWADTFWEGLYSGSLNSAFELGLDRWYFTHVARPTTTTSTTTTTTATPEDSGRRRRPGGQVDDDDYERRDDRGRQNQRGNDVSDADENSNSNDDDSYPSRQRRPTSGSDEAEPGELNRVSGTRDEVNRYDAQRAIQLGSGDDEQSSVSYTIAPIRVFVCEYFNNGQVGCRNCTERIFRIVLETGENGNRRDYNCTQPRGGPILKRWNANNGIIPMNPDPQAPTRQTVATCIFEKSARTYECHGESALCPDENGSRVHTNKCLSGRRWSGDYSGDFGYLS